MSSGKGNNISRSPLIGKWSHLPINDRHTMDHRNLYGNHKLNPTEHRLTRSIIPRSTTHSSASDVESRHPIGHCVQKVRAFIGQNHPGHLSSHDTINATGGCRSKFQLTRLFGHQRLECANIAWMKIQAQKR